MSDREHRYSAVVEWTGNRGAGTARYDAYGRAHEIRDPAGRKPAIPASSDPTFRGDAARWNPEELLVASLSACHQLWYLHLCADAGVVVTAYVDHAEGVMPEDADGNACFAHVVLRPRVTITAESDAAKARALHDEAHHRCFIARSVKFPVTCESEVLVAEGSEVTRNA